MKLRVVGVFALLAALLMPVSAHAEVKFKGLTVSPVNQEMLVTAGKPDKSYIDVGNHSKEPLTVVMSVKQFTAADYTYDFQFGDAKEDWIKFDQSQYVLQPDETVRVKYTVDAPELARPGGHYFALTASAVMGEDGIGRTAQVISQLFLKVDGKFVESGKIENGRVPMWVFNSEATYSYDARNTGNVHFVAEFYAELTGFFGEHSSSKVSHILLPDTVRRLGGHVNMPFLPGVYKITYGFRSDAVPDLPSRSAYVVYIPPWSIVALVLVLMIGKWLWQVRRARRTS